MRQGQSILQPARGDSGDVPCGTHPGKWQRCGDGGRSSGPTVAQAEGSPSPPSLRCAGAEQSQNRTKLAETTARGWGCALGKFNP